MLFLLVSLTVVASTSGYLTIYEHENRGGAWRRLYHAHNDFSYMGGWNDVVSSVRAYGESWELYTEADYWGGRMVVPDGQTLNVLHNDMYSSARPICVYSYNPDKAKLKVYEHWRSQGRRKTFYEDSAYVGDYWNDRISSFYTEKGDWEFYEHENFEGRREVVREGISRDLRDNDQASSIRPLCSTYEMTCKLKKMTIIDDGQVNPVSAGTEIIGSQSGGSCYGPGTQFLTLTSADSVEETTTIELSRTDEINWSVTTSVTVSGDAKFLGSGTSVEVGVSVGVGGSHSVTTTNSRSFSTGNEKMVGMGIEYSIPGAALAFGYVERFTIDNAYVPVDLKMECPDGTTPTKRSRVKLNAVTYSSSNFWSLNGQFNMAACRKNRFLPSCINNVRRRYSYGRFDRRRITEAFEACFDNGKGRVGK